MARTLYGTVLPLQRTVGQDGVLRIGFVGTIDMTAAGDGDTMGQFGAALGDEQIVVATSLIYMGTLGPPAARAPPYTAALCQLAARLGVYLAERDRIVGIAHHVAFLSFEVERGVDAALLQPHGLTPGAGRMGGRHQEVVARGIALATHIGRNQIVAAIVMADGGSIDALPSGGTLQRQLRPAVEHIAYLLPVLQVGRMEDGHTGKIFERGVDQIIVGPHPADTGVRMETRNDRIPQRLCPHHLQTAHRPYQQQHSSLQQQHFSHGVYSLIVGKCTKKIATGQIIG